MYYTQEELRNADGSKSIHPIIYHDEEWRKIIYDDIKPIYWISNYGRIFSENTNKVMEQKITNCGYCEIGLWKTNETKKFYLVHRLVLIMFNPVYGFEYLSANHINGHKMDNRLWNLEWVTMQENIHHAFETNLRKVGEDLGFSIYTNEQIHAVCKCMEDGKSSSQIAKEVFGSGLTKPLMSLFAKIYGNILWKQISNNYHIENFPRNCTFSNPQAERICQLISANPNISNKEIINDLQLHIKSSAEYNKYASSIAGIRYGKTYKHISSKYNI